MNPKVDFYFNKAKNWHTEIDKLRTIVLDCGLQEELKWGCPCYMHEKNNIVLIHVFKDYCALLFFKGALLKDKKRILVQQTENVQSARQMRFTNLNEILSAEVNIVTYLKEAVAIENAGLKVELKKTADYKIPAEFQNELINSHSLKSAFEALTPGRQRAYILFFSSPKHSSTRVSRIKKSIPLIIIGKGLND